MMDNPKQREVHARATETISADVAARMKAWYILVRQMLPGPGAGIVVTLEEGQIGQIFVSANLTDNDKPALAKAVAAVGEQDGPVVDNGVFALPLRRGGEVYAALAIQLEAKGSQQRSVMKLLTWAERWQRLLLTAGAQSPAATAPRLDLLETVFSNEPLPAALMALADQVADQLVCQRVAVGLRGKRGFRLEALSHGMQFDRRSTLATALAEAMDLVEDTALFWPNEDDPALEDLAAAGNDRAICVIPIGDNCALVCERETDRPFSLAELNDIVVQAPMLGSALDLKRQQDGLVPRRTLAATGGLFQRLFGPGHRGAKAVAAVAALVVLALALVPGTFRVHAEATIEGRVQRAVVAPFDGFIAEANRRAGDTVAAGEVIARLEDRELKLEMRKSASEEEKLDKEYRRALAAEDRSEARIVQARLAQVQAQTRLLREKLDRVQLSAPVAGVVISGDLSRSLGAPVERGDVLFEVAPLDEYRLILHVEESSVAHVAAGQTGTLTLTALPGNTYRFTVEQVSPVFTEREGVVSYRTEGRIDGEVPVLRPGMEGVGKIEIGRRSYGYILFHRMLEWLQLKLWLWLP